MAAIFPPFSRGGVPPGPNVCEAYTPEFPTIGEGPLYVSPDCTTVLTDCQLNGIVSEILAAVDKLGFPYNSSSITNLGDALAERFRQAQTGLDGKLDIAGGTMTGPLNVVCPPVNDNEAACKLFVEEEARRAADACCALMQDNLDNAMAGVQTQLDRKVNRDGDQMTGDLILAPNAPMTPNSAAPRWYVDAAAGGIYVAPEPPTGVPNNRLWWDSSRGQLFLRFEDRWVQVAPGEGTGGGGGGAPGPSGGPFLLLAGGQMAGPLLLHTDMPTMNQEAATKRYVDESVANVTGAFIDAPHDGYQYARQDGDWERVVGAGGGIPDSPHDGFPYVRQDGEWERTFGDSPHDTYQYVRQDGAWERIEALADDAPDDGELYGRQNRQWVTIDLAAAGNVDGGVF